MCLAYVYCVYACVYVCLHSSVRAHVSLCVGSSLCLEYVVLPGSGHRGLPDSQGAGEVPGDSEV